MLCPRSARVIVTDNRVGVLGRTLHGGQLDRGERLGWEEKRNMAAFFEKCLLAHSILHDVSQEAVVKKWRGKVEGEQEREDMEGK